MSDIRDSNPGEHRPGKGLATFKRNWGIILAVLIALLGVLVMWKITAPIRVDLPQYAYDAPTTSHVPGGKACLPHALAKLKAGKSRDTAQAKCDDEAEAHRLQINDLVQQSRAADAAQAQARLGEQAVWIAFLQTLGGFLTLIAAIAAAAYARSAARAAQDSLAHSQRVAANDLRPYLDFAMCEFKDAPDGGKHIVVKIQNFGKMPAMISRVEVGRSLVVGGGKFALPKMGDSGFDPRVVAPGHFTLHFNSFKSARGKAMTAALEARNGTLIFQLRVWFGDVSGTFEDSLQRAWRIGAPQVAGHLPVRVSSRHLLKPDSDAEPGETAPT